MYLWFSNIGTLCLMNTLRPLNISFPSRRHETKVNLFGGICGSDNRNATVCYRLINLLTKMKLPSVFGAPFFHMSNMFHMFVSCGWGLRLMEFKTDNCCVIIPKPCFHTMGLYAYILHLQCCANILEIDLNAFLLLTGGVNY